MRPGTMIVFSKGRTFESAGEVGDVDCLFDVSKDAISSLSLRQTFSIEHRCLGSNGRGRQVMFGQLYLDKKMICLITNDDVLVYVTTSVYLMSTT